MWPFPVKLTGTSKTGLLNQSRGIKSLFARASATFLQSLRETISLLQILCNTDNKSFLSPNLE